LLNKTIQSVAERAMLRVGDLLDAPGSNAIDPRTRCFCGHLGFHYGPVLVKKNAAYEGGFCGCCWPEKRAAPAVH
jgi:hypothetical protein